MMSPNQQDWVMAGLLVLFIMLMRLMWMNVDRDPDYSWIGVILEEEEDGSTR